MKDLKQMYKTILGDQYNTWGPVSSRTPHIIRGSNTDLSQADLEDKER
jgi:hypothetical protein